jgi:2-polyprenyl-3-methyl-5-hydroxy-6-metoxy-1,4-benzoquinol methylase
MVAPLPGDLDREIVIVDDGSSDGTRTLVENLAKNHPDLIRAVYQDHNQGKGAAIRRGINETTGEFIIFQDADLEYDPNEYPLLLEPIISGFADVVYGSRFASRKMRRVFNYHHHLGNKFLTHLSNMTTGLDLTDMETCYKAFRSDILRTIPIRSNRFGIEPEITAKIAKRNCRVYEVPISYRGRSYNEGKKINWQDGVSAILTILKYFFIDDCFNENFKHANLQSLSNTRRLNQWMVKLIEPFFGDRILEVGAGIGNISRQLPQLEKLIVTERSSVFLEILHQAYGGNEIVDVVRLDLTMPEDFENVGREVCDTVLCLNVLEHIENDLVALERMSKMLQPGGQLILLVPQYRWLYGSYDQVAGHYRRYSRKDIENLLNKSGYSNIRIKSFNFISIPAWWLNSCLLKRKRMSRIQLKIYDTLVPMMQLLERCIPLPGLSLVCIAEKPAQNP